MIRLGVLGVGAADEEDAPKMLTRSLDVLVTKAFGAVVKRTLGSREVCILVAAVASDTNTEFPATADEWRTRTPNEWANLVVSYGEALHRRMSSLRGCE